ncbi:hypothetical protein BT96DRAFT_747115, partial [Gymnopus androsaceus JB14]
DTGRPETSKEFAARMKGRVRILGPRRREQEGGSTSDGTDGKTTESHDRIDSIMGDVSTSPITDNVVATPEVNLHNVSLLNVLSTTDGGIDLPVVLKGRYKEDPLFKKILDSPNSFSNFEVLDNLIYLKQKDSKVLCIPRIIINGRSAQELIISEAHSLLAHLGASKTIDYLRDHVWWK